MHKNGTFVGETVSSLSSGELPIRYTAAPLKNTAGKIIGALEFIADNSEIKNAMNDSNLPE